MEGGEEAGEEPEREPDFPDFVPKPLATSCLEEIVNYDLLSNIFGSRVFNFPGFNRANSFISHCADICLPVLDEWQEDIDEIILSELSYFINDTFNSSHTFTIAGTGISGQAQSLEFTSDSYNANFLFNGDLAFSIRDGQCVRVIAETNASQSDPRFEPLNKYVSLYPQNISAFFTDYIVFDQITAGRIHSDTISEVRVVAPQEHEHVKSIIINTYPSSTLSLQGGQLRCTYSGQNQIGLRVDLFDTVTQTETSQFLVASQSSDLQISLDALTPDISNLGELSIYISIPSDEELREQGVNLPGEGTALNCSISGINGPIYTARRLYPDIQNESLLNPDGNSFDIAPITFSFGDLVLRVYNETPNQHPVNGVTRYQIFSDITNQIFKFIISADDTLFQMNQINFSLNSDIPFAVPGNLIIKTYAINIDELAIPYVLQPGLNQLSPLLQSYLTTQTQVSFVPDQMPEAPRFEQPYTVDLRIESIDANPINNGVVLEDQLESQYYFYEGYGLQELHDLPTRIFTSELFKSFFYVSSNSTQIQRHSLEDLPDEIEILNTTLSQEGYTMSCIKDLQFLTNKKPYIQGYQLVLQVEYNFQDVRHNYEEFLIAHDAIASAGFSQSIDTCAEALGDTTISLKFVLSPNAPQDEEQEIQAGETFRIYLNYIDLATRNNYNFQQTSLEVFAGFDFLGELIDFFGRLPEGQDANGVITDPANQTRVVPGKIIRF